MPRLTVNGGEIYYEESGSGHPLILAHGIGGNHAIWFQQLPVLSRHFRVITFDHRGFGNSIDDNAAGRSAFVADLEALLDHLEIPRAAFAGQSMGGGTCLGFAAAYPERVTALILCDSLHGFIEPPAVKAIMDSARESTANLSQLERVLGQPSREGNQSLATLYTQINSFNLAGRRNLAGRFWPLVAPDALAGFGFPVLFLVGADDVLFPSEAVRQMHQAVPGSRFVEVPGVGHSVFFEDAAAFNAELLSFLQSQMEQANHA